MCGACCLGTLAGAGKMGVGEQMQTEKSGLQSGCDDKKKRVGFGQIVDFLFHSPPLSFHGILRKKGKEGLLAKLPNSSPSRRARAKLTAPPL